LVFAIHPIQVEPVGWMSGLKDVLSGLLALVALWQYLVFAKADAQQPGSGRRSTLVLASAAFVLAMLAKPSAMTLPVIAVWVDYWIFRRPLKRVAPLIGGWLALSLVCAVVAKLCQPAPVTAVIPIWIRPFLATDSLAFYLYKIIWPANLCINYDRRAVEMIHRHSIFITWIVPLAIAAALFIWRKSARPYIAAAGILLFAVAPVLSLVSFDFQDYSINADHYLYVAMLGVGLAVAWALRSVKSGAAMMTIIALLVLILGVISFRQATTWHDGVTLFTHTLAVNPRSGVAYENLASAALREHQIDKSISLSLKAVALRPRDSVPHTNLGVAYDLSGRKEEAKREYLEAIRLEPNKPNAYSSLAAMLASMGQVEEAIPIYEQALKLDPDFRDARIGLQSALAAKGKGTTDEHRSD
jgi:hypothetical protein